MHSRFKPKTTWRAKLEKPQESRVVEVPEEMLGLVGPGRLLISTPLEVDALIREVPPGALITPGEIRSRLAARHGADAACPFTTGIFVRIAAEAALEDEQAGREPVTPFWRVVTEAGRLNPKLPGGMEEQRRRLEAEGHSLEVRPRQSVPSVVGFESRLMQSA